MNPHATRERITRLLTLFRPAVRRLFLSCGPSAIFRAISSVVIDPLQCQSLRTISHVFTEVCKRVLPPFTNRDASGVVIFGLSPLWVAPSFHGFPRSVRTTVNPPMLDSHKRGSCTQFMNCALHALLRVAVFKIVSPYGVYRAAVASHLRPIHESVSIMAARSGHFAKHSKFAVLRAGRDGGVGSTICHSAQYHVSAQV